MKFFTTTLLLSLTLLIPFRDAQAQTFEPPPGTVQTDWVGNSLPGNGGPNGTGFWVQNGVDEIEVAPNGTVFCGIDWDEAGRCIGLYRNGEVNQTLWQTEGGDLPDSAWGWGTGNHAIALDGNNLYAANRGNRLIRFTWSPGNLNSGKFQDAISLPGSVVGMTARNQKLVLVYEDGTVEVRGALPPYDTTNRFTVSGARDAVLAANDDLWIMTESAVRLYKIDGTSSDVTLPNLLKPSALGLNHQNQLLVCDIEPSRQQVLTYDLTNPSVPKRVATFGVARGLSAGVPGENRPEKLFGLRGAATDAQGNLYVAMGFHNSPAGNFFLRAFSPKGGLLWERFSTAFVDTFSFDPLRDGQRIVGRTVNFDLKLAYRGHASRISAITLDTARFPNDDRIAYGCTMLMRYPQGKPLYYTIGQYAGGYRLYVPADKGGHTLQQVGSIGATEQWAWNVDTSGNIWHGDAPDRKILRYRFRQWNADGTPDFDWQNPDTYDWPAGWDLIRRVLYDVATDRMYITGYRTGENIDSWGVIGKTGIRYDGWLNGGRTSVWTATLPVNPTGENGSPLTASGITLAGDYLFVGMVKPDNDRQYIHIYSTADSYYVGSLSPGAEVGGSAGWLDMPYSVQAMKRRNGEYLILAEEDYRGKNLLYRWRPDGHPRN